MSKIDIQFTLFSAFYSPLILVMEGGFLRDEGLDHSWSVSPPGKSAVDAIADGSAQVIQTALIQAINDLEQDREPVAVNFAQINEMDGFFITGREPDDDFRWDKLQGSEVVMFGGGQPNYMFRYACHRAGIDYDRIIPITPGGPDAIDSAFREGQGRFVQQQGPYPHQLEHEGIGHVVASVGERIGSCAFSTLAASREWLETDIAAAFMSAYRRARVFLSEATAEEVAALEKPFFPDTDPDALARCIHAYQQLGCWTTHVEITPEAYEVTLDVFEHAGGTSRRHTYEMVCCLPPGSQNV